MLSPYRRVLSLPGAIAFSGAAFVARMPISMLSLGIVLLVAGRTGSYGYAGGIAAAYILANAVAAPVQGRLTDRLGQARVLPVSITAFGVALAALMAAVQGDAPVPLPHLIAVLVGVALPQVGSSVRARWAHLLRERPQRQRDLHTAYAFESVVDEAIFITGPVLVTLLATAVHPLAGLSAALVAAVSGTFLLAAQRSTEPPVDRRAHAGDAREPLGWRILLPVA
ncbi:MAG TPA: MFS transporter, partial [Nocardioidaceae bacterium]|nr:MFS transporter [Nocardioidaceae bacterium]